MVKARGVYAVEFMRNVAIGSIPRPVVSRRESRRSPALIERPALAPSFLISLFLSLSFSLSLTHSLPFSLSLSLSLSLLSLSLSHSLARSLSSSLTWLVSCASLVNHGNSYFCTSSSSSATMPNHRRLSRFLSRLPSAHTATSSHGKSSVHASRVTDR